MKETIGIFEAKTKLSEICTRVEEGSVEYVITRRGRAVARIVPMKGDRAGGGHGIHERMRRTVHQHGPLTDEEADFPDVWKARLGSRHNPLEEREDSSSGQ